MSFGRVESHYLVGAASPSGHSISSHSSEEPSPSLCEWAARTRTRAKHEDSHSAEPSRHLIVRQAFFGSASACYLPQSTCGSPQRPRFAGRLLRFSLMPGTHTRVLDGMPATYLTPSAVSVVANL